MEYLPFWLGGLALGGVAVWQWIAEGRTLGVTGQVSKLVDAIADPEGEDEAVAFSKRDPNDVLAALAAATAAEMGVEIEAPAAQDLTDGSRLDMQRHVPLGFRIAFLLAIVLGALLAAAADGTLAVRWDLGEVHTAFLGDGWARILLLLGGGVAIGFGTRMAGGCTSGHGLSGCSRFVPRSLLATAVFMGTAIGFTLLTSAIMGR